MVYKHVALWTVPTWRSLLSFLLVTSMTVSVTTGETTCKWTRLKDTATDVSGAASVKSVTSVTRCRDYCTSDAACVAFAYGNRTCYTFHRVLPPRLHQRRWYYYSKECTTVPRTTPAFLPAVDSEKLSCTWNEIRNSAADESKAADRFYFQSLFQCWAYCDADSRCLVATFNSPVCQVYYVTVPPVHSVGTTYLAKSCKDTEMADVAPPVTSAPSSTTALSDESTLLTSVPLATSAEFTASVVKEEPEEKPPCTWIRVDDSSAGDKSAAAVKYLVSREECQQYCDEYPGCEVVVYKPLACRIFEDGVEPVDDVGWTFLRKSCREAKPNTLTGEVGTGTASEPENETSEPETQPPTEPDTESPIEPVTQSPTEPETESPIEPVTQSPTEPENGRTSEPKTDDSEPDTETETSSTEPAPSCAWIEVPDTSGGQSAPTDTVYFFSQEECTGYCDAMPACVVAVFNSPVCRIFSYDVTPVDDVGWTYLKKYCTPAADTSTAFVPSTTQLCTWTEVQERSAKQVREVDTDSVSSLEECQESCRRDSSCEAVLFNPPLCRKVFGATPVDEPGWEYLKKTCVTTDTPPWTLATSTSSSDNNEIEANAETVSPSVSSAVNTWTDTEPATVPLYCTWMELPDTSVAEGPPTNTTFVLSQEECTEYCDSLPACVVAVFNAPECRVFDHVVTPVDDVGSVYLQKFCASTENMTVDFPTSMEPSVTPEDNPADYVLAETSALSDSSTSAAPATAAPCTWEELADTSVDDSVLVETLYSPSLARCKALCEADSTCTVVIFSSSVCRKFHDVTPRADDGWTYLRKSCPPDRISLRRVRVDDGGQ
ncbi:mucin-17-like [Pomacea canaliculata]|uniref:mucin-17-like n=1 Tax=Pomacea canaliculata TaxID=400727 RepID=UPI000D728CBD|nr:mucin-17-like [Pomacea canaliculata]XP_025101869.1 mucin-17-like [Pomacea canaliculata]